LSKKYKQWNAYVSFQRNVTAQCEKIDWTACMHSTIGKCHKTSFLWMLDVPYEWHTEVQSAVMMDTPWNH
jgi:hypothetical protein